MRMLELKFIQNKKMINILNKIKRKVKSQINKDKKLERI